ncbi:hypothetical protein [Methylosinus sp. LW4]|uniref:hypothetical protein n=1 Tax=Methylosinus sp. LW4 TaxID=136993 RepID=UPI0012F993AA|nr:hypothetical protein [Methylosinus sp. LW4]
MRPLIERVLAACLAPESVVEEGAAQRASGAPALETRAKKEAAARGAPKRSVARKWSRAGRDMRADG